MPIRKFKIIFGEEINERFMNKIIVELFGLFSIDARERKGTLIFYSYDEELPKIRKYLNELRIKDGYEIERAY